MFLECLRYSLRGSISRAGAWAAIPGAFLLWLLLRWIGRSDVVLPTTQLGAIEFFAVCSALAWFVIFLGKLIYAPYHFLRAARLELAGYRKQSPQEMQLRAYISISEATVSNFAVGQILRISMTVRNSGQTPANKVVYHYSIMGDDYPRKKPLPQIDVPGRPTTLGPGNVHILEIPMKGPLPGPAYSRIQNGTLAIYVWGRVMYEDAFGYARETRFSYIFGPKFGPHPGGGVFAAEDGNTAT